MNNQNHSSEEQFSLLSEEDKEETYSRQNDYIFNILVAEGAFFGLSVDNILEDVANFLGVTKKDYLRFYTEYPSWPSPKQIIEAFNKVETPWKKF